MSKLKNNIQMKYLVKIIIIILIFLIGLLTIIWEVKNEKQSNIVDVKIKNEKQQIQTIKVPSTEQEIIEELSTYKERDRMEYYCGIYFRHIENKEYKSAYNLLYSEFKQTYFPTLEEYIAYIQKTYSSLWALEYNDISREGSIYVLRLDVIDILESTEKSQRIVVKENTYNDFVISFQVI